MLLSAAIHARDFRTQFADCPNIENLTIWISIDCPDITELISAFPLRRLSIDLDLLFNNQRPDFRRYTFPNLTHLEIVKVQDDWSHIAEISLLPNLTHLAYNFSPIWEIIAGSLERCKGLLVLVILDQDFEDIDSMLPQDEFRVVRDVDPSESWEHDWYEGVTGGEDFWVRAETVVAMRIQMREIVLEANRDSLTGL